MTETPRKPRLALLGEFSAGKSTLTNVLLGQAAAQVQVTATQLPPVWYSHGTGAPMRMDADGALHDLDGAEITDFTSDEMRALCRFAPAPFLERFDLIDMPGSSDPNMSPDAWDALMPEFDAVLWCTPATQAWRQSEAALWEIAPAKLRNRSALLLTRIDKIAAGKDRTRLLNRIRREAGDLFTDILPVALLDALGADRGTDAWDACGMAALDALINRMEVGDTRSASAKHGAPAATVVPFAAQEVESSKAPVPVTIVPRRVVGGCTDRPRRPSRAAAGDGPLI